jgi:hypothetical protein
MDERNDEQMGGTGEAGWSSGPDVDDTANPTDAAPDAARSRSATGREMLVQLQQMIDTIATQAAPVIRDVAVKAAELAAVAGEKAGPIAHKAADVTETVGQRVAARSKDFAADLRRHQETGGSEPETSSSADAERTDGPTSSDWTAS